MLNAPSSDGRGSRTAYQQLPGIPFARQGETRYQPSPPVSYKPQPLDVNAWQRFPGLNQGGLPSVPIQQGWAWQQDALTLQKPDKQEKTKDTEPPKHPEKENENPNEPVKQAQTVKSKPKPDQKPDKKPQPGTIPEKPQPANPKKDKAHQDQAPKNQKTDTKKESGFGLNASTLIGAFKVTSALLITGGINAFFFGVPLYIASGLSALVAGSQALTALKIHKEDSEFAKKIVGFSRKLMGRQNDPTPAGKEWSMVPVWAGICGAFGLTEAMGNHIYKSSRNKVEEGFDQKLKNLKSGYEKNKGYFKPVQGLQVRGMTFVQTSREKAKKLFEKWAIKGGVRKIPNQVYQYLMKSSGGRNMPAAYLWSFGMASFGGAAQTVLAALMQQKVDKAHGVKK